MILKINRYAFSRFSTRGLLFIDDVFFCHTLEDTQRDVKVKGCTAIDKGTYKIKITFSNRFQQFMPQLMNVPKFEGIRIHTGNTQADTEGCILVGYSTSPEFVGESRNAYFELMKRLKDQTDILIIIK